jgi:hypothetical protein
MNGIFKKKRQTDLHRYKRGFYINNLMYFLKMFTRRWVCIVTYYRFMKSIMLRFVFKARRYIRIYMRMGR